MEVRSAAALLGVRDVARSVEFYRRLGFVPQVQWETYSRLTNGAAVVHLAGAGDAPPDRPGVAMAAPTAI